MRLTPFLLILLLGCGSSTPTNTGPREYAPAMPTTDPLPADDEKFAEYRTSDFMIDIYADGMVRWHGALGMGSIGVRHARMPADTSLALEEAFFQDDIPSLDPSITEECPVGTTTHTLNRRRADWSIVYTPCPAVPELDRLIERITTWAGLDQFIRGNPEGPVGQLPHGDTAVAQLTRGGVCGTCPGFTVTLFDDGTVLWAGERSVAMMGEALGTIPRSVVDEVIAAFEEVSFFELARPDCEAPSGTPYAATGYQRDGRRHGVFNPHCGDPTPLWALEDRLEALLTGGQKWIAE